ncbi:hypothetical protein BC628DRAFT_1420257 [Trametes gibbosa]|nr:hypothetical protein BC628DRAFT_1420257 [Trametes gibbosa]
MAAVATAAPVPPPKPERAGAPVVEQERKSDLVSDKAPAPPSKGLRALRDRLPLRRAFSTKQASLSTPELLSSATPAREDVPSPVSKSPRSKLTAFERFVNARLGARKGGKKRTAGSAEDTNIQQSPVAVNLEVAPSSSSLTSSPEDEAALPAIPESAADDPEVQFPSDDVADPANPEPLPLARKIQSLLSNLPPFLTPLTASPATTPAHGGPDDDKKQTGTDTEQDPSAVIDNSRLISLLSSPTMMNGSLTRGRQSVWALLDNLRLKTLAPASGASAQHGLTEESTALPHDVQAIEDDDSVMFYGPLVPDASSAVELARSEIVSVDENGTVVDVLLDDAPLPEASPPKAQFMGIWPFSSGGASVSAPSTAKPKVLTEKRVWVPSTSQLSLQVMWWGYRLWLPPTIMNLLNDKEIEAAKVGAMLTTALQWLLSNVPDSALPSTLRPALALVKSLVPYLGYIGGFVAWSWGAIKGFDIGNGVTLTATWLLPIALIPGTWENNDVPQPPSGSAPSSDPGSTPTPSTPSPGDPSAPVSGAPTSGGDVPGSSSPDSNKTSPASPLPTPTPPAAVPATSPTRAPTPSTPVTSSQ